MIKKLCVSVWDGYIDSHELIVDYVNKDMGI